MSSLRIHATRATFLVNSTLRERCKRGLNKRPSMNSTVNTQPVSCYELHFRSLMLPDRGWAFPCDAEGRVDMDAMTERVRNNYLFARALVGIEHDVPRVRTIRGIYAGLCSCSLE